MPNGATLQYIVGTIAIYQCDNGYALLGLTTQKCVNSSTWSGQPPTCIKCELVESTILLDRFIA